MPNISGHDLAITENGGDFESQHTTLPHLDQESKGKIQETGQIK